MVILLLKFIESHLIDNHLFFHTRTKDGDTNYSVHWKKSNGKSHWTIKNLGTDQEMSLKSPDFVNFISSHRLCQDHLESCLREAVVNQVLLAKQHIAEAEKIFGRTVLDHYVDETESFYQNLIHNIKDQLKKAGEPSVQRRDEDLPRPVLRLIKNQKN